MAARIALVEYGAGNLTSVRKGFSAAGADLFTPATPADLQGASGIVVPGVGHFGATAPLEAEWRDAIGAQVRSGTPLLGICLGLQWLFEGSDEAPAVLGLGVLADRGLTAVVRTRIAGKNRRRVLEVVTTHKASTGAAS